MKESNKQNLKKALNEELQSIQLSNRSRRDILYNATHAQPPSDRKLLRYPAVVAAALIVMLGASLYISGQQTLPDTLQKSSTALTQGTVTETLPPHARPTPETTKFSETPIPTPLPTEAPMIPMADKLVWSTDGSHYYHLTSGCSGMANAIEMNESDALESGKASCPLCFGNMTVSTASVPDATPLPTEEPMNFPQDDMMVWSVPGSHYFHLTSECSGLSNAGGLTVSEAIQGGKSPCPICATAIESSSVWYTKNGIYYHLVSDCSGMRNADEMTLYDAIEDQKLPCPVCTAETVWSTNGATFYHLDSNCSGMANAIEMSEFNAIKSGKAACPICFGDGPVYASSTPIPMDDSAEEAMVWSTNGGTLYHLNSDCSGMANAAAMTRSDAIEAGKSPCSICFSNGDLNASQSNDELNDDSVPVDIEALHLDVQLTRYPLETGSLMCLYLKHEVNLRWLETIENLSDWTATEEVSSDNIDFESVLTDWLPLSDIESVQSTFESNGTVAFEIVTVVPLLNDVNTQFSSSVDPVPQGNEYRMHTPENAADKCVLYVLDQAISKNTAHIGLVIRHQQWYYDGHTIYRRVADNTIDEMEITILDGGSADMDEIPLEGMDMDASATFFTTGENRFLIFEGAKDADLSGSCLVLDNGESIQPDMVTNTTMHRESMLIWRWSAPAVSIHLAGENSLDLPITDN